MKHDSGDDEVPGYYSGGDVEADNAKLRIEVEQLRAEVANLRHYRDSDLLAAEAMHAGLAECERLRGALRGMLATHDQSHSEECDAWTSRDEDVCKCDDGCAEPHCDCGSLDARNAARAALGEP